MTSPSLGWPYKTTEFSGAYMQTGITRRSSSPLTVSLTGVLDENASLILSMLCTVISAGGFLQVNSVETDTHFGGSLAVLFSWLSIICREGTKSKPIIFSVVLSPTVITKEFPGMSLIIFCLVASFSGNKVPKGVFSCSLRESGSFTEI